MIWCVEDDSGIREIEVYTLNSTGFEARGFSDGASFREALETETPDQVAEALRAGADIIMLDNMSVAYKKLVKRIADLEADGTVDEGKFAEYKEKFCDAISNDLNTSMAITIVYDLLKDDTLNDATKRALAEDFDRVLSLNLTTAKVENPAEDTEVDAELEAYILEKIEERKAAKKEKDFAKADAIRDDLLAKGIVLKDTREGVIWHKA